MTTDHSSENYYSAIRSDQNALSALGLQIFSRLYMQVLGGLRLFTAKASLIDTVCSNQFSTMSAAMEWFSARIPVAREFVYKRRKFLAPTVSNYEILQYLKFWFATSGILSLKNGKRCKQDSGIGPTEFFWSEHRRKRLGDIAYGLSSQVESEEKCKIRHESCHQRRQRHRKDYVVAQVPGFKLSTDGELNLLTLKLYVKYCPFADLIGSTDSW